MSFQDWSDRRKKILSRKRKLEEEDKKRVKTIVRKDPSWYEQGY